jgi:predicted metal-dependent hydrolase
VTSELTFSVGALTAQLRLKFSPRAKAMRLRVDPRTGAVLLTVPKRASRRRALEWAAEQRGWIEAQLGRVRAAEPVRPGTALPLYGRPHILDWDPGRPRAVRVEEGRICAGGPLEGLEPRLLRWLKAHAHDLLDRESREFACKAGLEVASVGIGDPKSRWGSCSSSGALRYSWRLILAPEFVRRATVAHEVAHLAHMNHGPLFHALVAQLLGEDPSPARRWLRGESASLHLHFR